MLCGLADRSLVGIGTACVVSFEQAVHLPTAARARRKIEPARTTILLVEDDNTSRNIQHLNALGWLSFVVWECEIRADTFGVIKKIRKFLDSVYANYQALWCQTSNAI